KELQAKIAAWQKSMAQAPVPSEAELKSLHEHRQKITDLMARLKAGELHLAFTPDRDQQVTVTLDAAPPTDVALPAGKSQQWQARQQLRVVIPEVGTLQLGRSTTDQTLEQAAEDLATHERVYAATLKGFKVSPDHVQALDELRRRKLQHENDSRQLEAA